MPFEDWSDYLTYANACDQATAKAGQRGVR